MLFRSLVTDAIPLFEALHPDCIGVFLLNNSSNHAAFADDALVAKRMTLNEKPWPEDSKTSFRDTTVTLSNGEVLNQTFFYNKVLQTVDRKGKAKEKTVRYFKGIKKILEERGQWLGCDLDGKAWKLNCGDPVPGRKSVCCARHFLESRPDFISQKSALQEVIEGSGHIFELYPKYHCECNWIELYWSYAKRQARLHCDYSFKSLGGKH